MLRSSTKSTAELLLSRPPLSWVGRIRVRGRGVILAYHNVVPDGARVAGDRSLHIRVGEFARQLDHLREIGDLVPLEQLLESTDPTGESAGSGGRPRVAVTFDDAYLGAVTLGIDELVRRGIPATIFVAPGLLGRGPFWWDMLSWPSDPDRARTLRSHALGTLNGQAVAVVEWARAEGLDLRYVPPFLNAATEGEVASAADREGISIGGHSWSHPSLVRLPPSELQVELERPREWLSARVRRPIPWMAYPYGLTSPEVQRETSRAGYRGGLRVDGGWLEAGAYNPYAVPRMSVPAGLSFRGFQARLAGFLAER